MRITVLAHPKSNFEKVIEHEGVYNCYFNVPPEKNRANLKVIEMPSDYLGVPQSSLIIKVGKTARQKIVEVID